MNPRYISGFIIGNLRGIWDLGLKVVRDLTTITITGDGGSAANFFMPRVGLIVFAFRTEFMDQRGHTWDNIVKSDHRVV